jgi:osmoprotectant transport system substrate-binding protein/osmoprotectant transport system permease protein
VTRARAAGLALALAITCAAAAAPASPAIRVGSKTFTESVILGEVITALLESDGIDAQHRRALGGTRVLFDGLERGEIDVYPEYTGTLLREVFAGESGADRTTLQSLLEARGIGIAARLGFNNTYVLGMRAVQAADLGISRISDLKLHPDLRFGLSNEFMNRADGWVGLRAAYRLPQTAVRGMNHDLAYRAIASGAVDVIDLYSTDAEIDYYSLTRLDDDRGFFPRYDAVILHRLDLDPKVVSTLGRLDGRIDESTMVRLNAAVKIERRPEVRVAAGYVREQFHVAVDARTSGRWQRIYRRTGEHLVLVAISLGAAILVAIPLGILAALRPLPGTVLLTSAGVIQTIPALALLVFMIPWLGIGAKPAIAALFLYSLLPILRNTHAGLLAVPAHIRESAIALGLPQSARLRLVELPLAGRAILAGIKTAAVINVGTATLGALIGAGGYGESILTGIRLDDVGLILEGAIPAALLALAVQGLFEWIERRWVDVSDRSD